MPRAVRSPCADRWSTSSPRSDIHSTRVTNPSEVVGHGRSMGTAARGAVGDAWVLAPVMVVYLRVSFAVPAAVASLVDNDTPADRRR